MRVIAAIQNPDAITAADVVARVVVALTRAAHRLDEPGQVPARRRVAFEQLLARQRVVQVVRRRPDQVQAELIDQPSPDLR